MKIDFATAEEEKSIKEILAASDLHHQDITLNHLQHFFTLKDDTRVVGVVGLELKNKCALLRSLAVSEPYRHKGWATQLVNKIEAYATLQKVDTLYLLTMTAEDFFTKHGYQKADRQTAPNGLQETAEFKSLCPDSAVCMKKNL